MAGKFGAKALRIPTMAGFSNSKATTGFCRRPSLTPQPLFPNRSTIATLRCVSSVRDSSTPVRMATAHWGDHAQNGVTCEEEEASPKIQKQLHQNGAAHPKLPLLKVKRLSDKAVVPTRGSALAAGYDLSSAAEVRVPARGKALIPTDLSISIPPDTYARIAPRSGLAWKHSIDVGAGVIDADYRGALGVILFNHSDVDFEVKPGDRVAQLIIQMILTPEVVEMDDLDATVRGEGGFGSTGV